MTGPFLAEPPLADSADIADLSEDGLVYRAHVDPADVDVGALLGSLEGGFPWGLLVISDEGSSEPIPPWQTNQQQVTSTTSSVVVRVEHEQEGSAIVHVYKGAGDLGGEPAFIGAVTTLSGALTIGDVLGKHRIRVPGWRGTMEVRVFLNRPRQAVHVDVVIG